MADKNIRGLACLDILFSNVKRYRKSGQAKELFEFTASFPKLAPLNAMLVHIQQPGSRMVATAYDWLEKYGRTLKFNAKPLIILWPFAPVTFVFDISDTEPTDHAKEIPEEVINPFRPSGYLDPLVWDTLYDNLPGLGILAVWTDLGSQRGGSIQRMRGKYRLRYDDKYVKILYAIKLSRKADQFTNFSTLTHELGHLFCGHLAYQSNDKRFPKREELAKKDPKELKTIEEFEAEAVSWLVCRRLGLKTPSDRYLSSYWADKDKDLPDISLNNILWAAGKIEALCKKSHEAAKELLLDMEKPEAREYKEWRD